MLGKVKHELEDVLRITLIGVLASCYDNDEISGFIEERQEELVEYGFRMPSGDILRRIVEAVDPDQMRSALRSSREG